MVSSARSASNWLVALLLAAALPSHASEGNALRLLGLTAQPSTLISAGYEWHVQGDANRNASVRAQYRKVGSARWRDGLAPLRLQGERVVQWSVDFTAPNAFVGSLFDLEPDSRYEIRLQATDPDGVTGKSEARLTVKTRAVPVAKAGGRVFHVYPFGYKGPRQEPAFTGLLEAYYTGAVGGDWYNAFPPRVRPGDTILVHAGLYRDDRFRYGHELFSGFTECCTTTGDGTYYLTQSGTADAPIVIRAAGDGEVIFDGDGNALLFNVQAASYTLFDGLVFRNTEVAIDAGRKRIAGAIGLTVINCRFENINLGIHSDWAKSKNFYLTDNVFIGRNNPDVLMHWSTRGIWKSAPDAERNSRLLSQYAIKFYGSGNVVARNRVRNFHDGIDFATYGMPEGYPAIDRDSAPVSNDIYLNDISNVHDNCIEADGGMSNMRVFRNRCVNTAAGALSTQPSFGGPVWFVRNVVYNSPEIGPMTLPANSAGVVFYNNTFVANTTPNTPASNLHFRNNLFVATSAKRPVFAMRTYTSYSTSDYNGYALLPAMGAAFAWSAPADGAVAEYDAKKLVEHSAASLAEFTQVTGRERHGRQVDRSRLFANLQWPDEANSFRVYAPEKLSFALAPGSDAIDAGTVLPNITDGSTGGAPDLGAVESGADEPEYGPRTSSSGK